MKRWHWILIGCGVLSLFVFYMTASHWFRETYIITVTNTERDPNTGLKMVYGTTLDGETKAWTCEDSLLEGVVNSGDLFGFFAQGQQYKIRVYGVRWHWPYTSYENIVKVERYAGPRTMEDLDTEIRGLEAKLEELQKQRKALTEERS